MKKNNYYRLSHPGRRQTNEDRVLIDFNKKREDKQVILAVADGMGGYEKGDAAAQIVIEQLEKLNEFELSSEFFSLSEVVVKYIKEANRRIVELSEKTGISQMGTTVSGAVIKGNRCLFFNVGDSRTYTIRNGDIRQETRDHSADMDAFLNNVISEDEIGKGYYSHALTRCIGTDRDVEVDISPSDGFHDLKEGEIIFSCSDGLWNVVGKEEIHRELIGRANLEESLEALLALAYAKGSKDNISMAAFEYGMLPRRNLNLKNYPPVSKSGMKKGRQKKKFIVPALWVIVIILFLAVLGLLVTLSRDDKGKGTSSPGNDRKQSTSDVYANHKQTVQSGSEIEPERRENKFESQGGRIEFSPSGGKYSGGVQVLLKPEPLKVRGEEISTEIFYTIDGSEPSKERGTKYERSDKIVFNTPGKYTIKAKSIPKAGNYKCDVYSQVYTIQSKAAESTIETVTDYLKLDQDVRKYIFEKTKRISIEIERVKKIEENNGAIKIELFIAQNGNAKVGDISSLGFVVKPEGKLGEIKSALKQKIEGIIFLPPTKDGKHVNARLGIDFVHIAKSRNSNKILLERE